MIRFGEWLPDLPDLDNPGLLTAQNALFLEGAYRPFKALGSSGLDALASEPLGGLVTASYTYVGLATSLQRSTTALGTWTDYSKGTSYSTATSWAFARYKNLVIATNRVDVPQYQTLGSGSDFADLATSGTAPNAAIVGKIGQFIFLGNTNTATYHVQWSAIDNPNDWPTPASADAVSKQSGQHYLRPEWGAVTGIVGGDQFGVIFQEGGLTRVTYAGGDVAFQFDEIEGAKGCFFPKSIVEVGGVFYYISAAGFMLTDGVKSVPVGANKFDQYFWDSYWQPNVNRVTGAVDANRKMIFWAYPAANESNATRIIAYNYESDRATHCEQDLNLLLSDPEAAVSTTTLSFRAFNTSHAGRKFNGTIQTAVLTSAETELHLGGRTHVQGVKPLVVLAAGATPTITVALGARNDQDDDSISFTSESTPHSRTGFAGFRSDARYHRARVTISGAAFDSATGLQFQAVQAGSA